MARADLLGSVRRGNSEQRMDVTMFVRDQELGQQFPGRPAPNNRRGVDPARTTGGGDEPPLPAKVQSGGLGEGVLGRLDVREACGQRRDGEPVG